MATKEAEIFDAVNSKLRSEATELILKIYKGPDRQKELDWLENKTNDELVIRIEGLRKSLDNMELSSNSHNSTIIEAIEARANRVVAPVPVVGRESSLNSSPEVVPKPAADLSFSSSSSSSSNFASHSNEGSGNDFSLRSQSSASSFSYMLSEGEQLLFTAIEKEDIAEVQGLLAQSNVNVNCVQKGYSPLIWAAELGNLELVRILLDHQAEIDYFCPVGSFNQTALIAATIDGFYDVAEELLKRGARPDVSAQNSDKAILIAALNGHFNIVRLLATYGADVNALNIHSVVDYDNGSVLESPLYYVAAAGDCETAEILLKCNANLNSQNIDGQTPTHIAVLNNKSDVLIMLAKQGANLSLSDRFGNTPLHYSCENSNIEITQFLVSFGADVNVENSEGRVPLELAFSSESTEMVAIFLDSGTDLNRRFDGGTGRTLVQAISVEGDEWIDMLYVVLQRLDLLDLAIRDMDGRTALDLAVHYNQGDSHIQTICCLQNALLKQKPQIDTISITLTDQLSAAKSFSFEQTKVNRKVHRNLSINLTPSLRRNDNVVSTESLLSQILNSYDKIIEHASRRIDFCFYTLLYYYNTKRHIIIGQTLAQYGQGEGKFTGAAHSAFIANPYVFLNCFSVDGNPLIMTLNQDNHFFRSLNSTIELPVCVNQFDSLLENKINTPSKWRRAFLTILNQVSFGIRNPISGLTDLFTVMQDFFNEIRITYLSSREQTKYVIFSLQYKGTFSGWDDTKDQIKPDYLSSMLRIHSQQETALIKQANAAQKQLDQLYHQKFQKIKDEINTGNSFLSNQPQVYPLPNRPTAQIPEQQPSTNEISTREHMKLSSSSLSQPSSLFSSTGPALLRASRPEQIKDDKGKEKDKTARSTTCSQGKRG